MPIPIKIVYQCRLKFNDLDLASAPNDQALRLKDEERFCRQCNMRVYNFNNISEEKQVEILEQSRRAGTRLCVSRSFPVFPRTKLDICSNPEVTTARHSLPAPTQEFDNEEDVVELMGDVATVDPSDPIT